MLDETPAHLDVNVTDDSWHKTKKLVNNGRKVITRLSRVCVCRPALGATPLPWCNTLYRSCELGLFRLFAGIFDGTRVSRGAPVRTMTSLVVTVANVGKTVDSAMRAMRAMRGRRTGLDIFRSKDIFREHKYTMIANFSDLYHRCELYEILK